MKKTSQLLLQYLLPHHIVSRLAGIVARCRIKWLKNFLIKKFIVHYQVNMEEAAEPNPENYSTFNSFFIRALKPGARHIIATEKAVISPVDGTISQIGKIEKNHLLQAKGKQYTLKKLLVVPEIAEQFFDGSFATLYLSPKDYHRIHMPITGKLHHMIYVPGSLFTVNELAVKNITQVFGRNERVINVFDTMIGPMAVILVGAMIVGSIATSWQGIVAPPCKKCPQMWRYIDQNIVLQRGDELGHFQLGSTVILLFAKDALQWVDTLKCSDKVQMGNMIGKINL